MLTRKAGWEDHYRRKSRRLSCLGDLAVCNSVDQIPKVTPPVDWESTGGAMNVSIYDCLVNDVDPVKALRATEFRGFGSLPSSLNLAGAEIELVPMMARETRLRRCIGKIRDNYDYVLIDCPALTGPSHSERPDGCRLGPHNHPVSTTALKGYPTTEHNQTGPEPSQFNLGPGGRAAHYVRRPDKPFAPGC